MKIGDCLYAHKPHYLKANCTNCIIVLVLVHGLDETVIQFVWYTWLKKCEIENSVITLLNCMLSVMIMIHNYLD